MTGTDPAERAGRQGRALRELAIVQRLSATQLNRALRPLGLSLTHVSVLAHLSGPDGATVGEIARVMDVNQPGVSKIVTALADQDAVEIATADHDGRLRVVHLTPTGRRLLAQARVAMHPQATRTFTDLDDAQLDLLHGLLVTIHQRLDATGRHHP
jgi:DNA-binding MarR family transcriptional regulator